jgi:hypothetical protein
MIGWFIATHREEEHKAEAEQQEHRSRGSETVFENSESNGHVIKAQVYAPHFCV